MECNFYYKFKFLVIDSSISIRYISSNYKEFIISDTATKFLCLLDF